MKSSFGWFFAFPLVFMACGFLNEDGDIPSYLKIEEISLETIEIQGESSHKILDVWISADGVNLGVYPLPAQIPIIPNAPETDLIIFAGIRNNGIQSNPIIYPFYEKIERTENLRPPEELNLSLNFRYNTTAKFALIENFENSNIFTVDLDENPLTELKKSSDDVMYGNAAGMILLDDTNRTLQVATAKDFVLPVDGTAVFLEIDYKNDIDLLVGLIGVEEATFTKFFKLVLPPQEEWNKIYVDFSEDLANSQFSAYKVLFGAELNTDEVDKATILLDNIKLIHF